jgi:hypothetical protein
MPPMPKQPGIGRTVGAGTLMTWPQVHTALAPTSCELRVDRGLEISGRAALHGIYAGFRLMARCWSGTTATIADPGVVVCDRHRAVFPARRSRQRYQGGDRQDQKNTAGSTRLQLEA